MLYGCYFYPVYALACDQLTRVQEAAARAKCNALGAPKSQYRDFKSAVEHLIRNEIMTGLSAVRWDASRRLRNMGSTEIQTLYTLGHVEVSVCVTADLINELFDLDAPEFSPPPESFADVDELRKEAEPS